MADLIVADCAAGDAHGSQVNVDASALQMIEAVRQLPANLQWGNEGCLRRFKSLVAHVLPNRASASQLPSRATPAGRWKNV